MTFHLWSFVVGDFGLATSSLAAVDPSDVSPRVVLQEADMTLGWFIFSYSERLSDGSTQRLGRAYTLRLKFNPGGDDLQIILKPTCTVLG